MNMSLRSLARETPRHAVRCLGRLESYTNAARRLHNAAR
jgi:hypothetical protein